MKNVLREFATDDVESEDVAEYEAAGHTPEVAKRLARASAAAERAIDAGVIRESVNKQNKRAIEINMPAGVEWKGKLAMACANVKLAAKLLDDAKINDLKRSMTRDMVLKANERWEEQIERLRNFHPNFDEDLVHE